MIILETEVYFRWNFLRLPASWVTAPTERTLNIFAQGGVGLYGVLVAPTSVREISGDDNTSRASILLDGTIGATIPLSPRWHVEPFLRGGYPYIFGAGVTLGHKFPLRRRVEQVQLPPVTIVEIKETIVEVIVEVEVQVDRIVEQIVEVIVDRPVIVYVGDDEPAETIVTQIRVPIDDYVEYIIFGPNVSDFNTALHPDAVALNTLVINNLVSILQANPHLNVQIAGHANPVTGTTGEVPVLSQISRDRANQVAIQLIQSGVDMTQITVSAHGGTRAITTQQDEWTMNRRVELTLVFNDEQ
jgi:hypothetical protein